MVQAQEIMVLASRASVSTPPRPTEIQKSGSHVPANTRFTVPDPRKTFATHVSAISSRIPAVPQAPALPRNTPPGYQNYTPDPRTSSGVQSSVAPPVSRASSAQQMQQASPVAVAEPIRPIGTYKVTTLLPLVACYTHRPKILVTKMDKRRCI